MATPTESYIRRIRNPAKKAYATAMMQWILNPSMDNEPERPDNLSFMAGQAVRIELYRLNTK
jgi:hypothetical protein